MAVKKPGKLLSAPDTGRGPQGVRLDHAAFQTGKCAETVTVLRGSGAVRKRQFRQVNPPGAAGIVPAGYSHQRVQIGAAAARPDQQIFQTLPQKSLEGTALHIGPALPVLIDRHVLAARNAEPGAENGV